MNIDIKLPVAISEANSLVGLLNIFKEVEQGQNHIVYKTAGHVQLTNLEFVEQEFAESLPWCQGDHTIICFHFHLGFVAAFNNGLPQLSICNYIFFIPSIAIYLLLFLKTHQAIDNSF